MINNCETCKNCINGACKLGSDECQTYMYEIYKEISTIEKIKMNENLKIGSKVLFRNQEAIVTKFINYGCQIYDKGRKQYNNHVAIQIKLLEKTINYRYRNVSKKNLILIT